MADTVTEQTLDQQLESIFNTSGDPKSPASPDGTDKAALGDKKPGSVPSPDPASKTEGEEGTDPLEDKLKEITEEETEKEEEGPKLTDDQQAVLAAIPSAQVAQQLYGVVENYKNFTGAFESGDFNRVDAMFTNWNPEVYDAFMEHIYQKHMVNGDWTERFIAEAEGRGPQQKGMKTLEQKIAKLENELRNKGQGDAQAQERIENARIAQSYENYVAGLFDKIEFAKADRKWVMSELNTLVGSDQKVMKAVRSGNLSAVNALFKTAIREYVNRDKEVSEDKNARVDAQSKKKVVVSGGIGTPGEGELPSDVKQVPKGQEENWMMQELGKLAKKVGIKK